MSRALILRADGSAQMGFGHVMRCLALAEWWTRGPVVLRSHQLPIGLRDVATTRGVRVVDAATAGDEQDARATANLALDVETANDAPVVVDGYHFDDAFRKTLHDLVRLCWIDDAGTLDEPSASVVVNQNLGAERAWYPAASPATDVLAGERYALLRPSFAHAASATRTRQSASASSVGKRVVMTFGGSDPAGWSTSVLDALSVDREVLGVDTVVDLVLGSGLADPDHVIDRARSLGVRPLLGVTSMATTLASATVVLAAAGTTVLELACLGVPAVLVVAAANQAPVATAAHAAGIAEVCTRGAADALQSVGALLADGARRASMSYNGRALVDGHGAERVADEIARS